VTLDLLRVVRFCTLTDVSILKNTFVVIITKRHSCRLLMFQNQGICGTSKSTSVGKIFNTFL